MRRPWRGRGLARALLLTALEEFRRRGLPAAYLGVDTLNPTGALHLYTSVGMTQAGEVNAVFAKVLTLPEPLRGEARRAPRPASPPAPAAVPAPLTAS